MNPADIFAKHLTSKDNINHRTSLSGCECRGGRAATAPLLRPRQHDSHLPGDDGCEDARPNLFLAEARDHDSNVLPHHYGRDEKDRMFPEINAPPPIVNVPAEDAEGVSDVFVKCFISDNDKQETDTHYRC